MSEHLKIANCRGKKPVLNDIKNCISTLDNLFFEMNACDARFTLILARAMLYDIIDKEGYHISNTNRLIKKDGNQEESSKEEEDSR